MALPRKKARQIVVADTLYEWVASGNDEFIAVTIGARRAKGQKLLAQLDYSWVVTPALVAQLIAYGLAQGWAPGRRGKDWQLYAMDDKLERPGLGAP